MFKEFSARFFGEVLHGGYELTAPGIEQVSEGANWVAEKFEMATHAAIHLVNAEGFDFQKILAYDAALCERASNLTNVYILAGGEVPDFTGAQEYFGQAVYSMFWHLNLSTGEVTAAKGQPKKFFNVRDMVASAWQAYAENGAGNLGGEFGDGTVTAQNFAEISHRAAAARPQEKYRHAVVSYMVIFLNVAILALMFLDGYYDGDLEVITRFGAIVPEYVVYGGEWWRLFSAMFLHFGVMHLFANVFGILIFGMRLEKYLGRRMFVAVYILAGLLGSAFSLAHDYIFAVNSVAAGASGAVYGLVGAIFAYTRITKQSIDFINWYVMLIYIGMGFAIGFATPNIGNFAHLGGLVGGAAIGAVYAFRTRKTR